MGVILGVVLGLILFVREYIDTKYGEFGDVKVGFFVSILFEEVLHTLNALIEHVDILHLLHGFGDDGVAIVVHHREVLRTSLSIESTGIHDFDMVVEQEEVMTVKLLPRANLHQEIPLDQHSSPEEAECFRQSGCQLFS